MLAACTDLPQPSGGAICRRKEIDEGAEKAVWLDGPEYSRAMIGRHMQRVPRECGLHEDGLTSALSSNRLVSGSRTSVFSRSKEVQLAPDKLLVRLVACTLDRPP